MMDPTLFFHHRPVSQQQTGMVCNIVGQVTGLFSESQYVALDKLSETLNRHRSLNKLLRTIISTWEVVGFHGSIGMYLDATGVHIQQWLDPPHTSGLLIGTLIACI
ncbi:uncharacterized protein LOC131322263 [Rhododendron vialii]|uniref:uncharacterized protein LOC131322263 n=1 Tax=Rhododendron vialii TaxID=182163 RepID=UPI00265E9DCF|nr:uncharacterized protein LOC131322263 [Rhododendron vialii]